MELGVMACFNAFEITASAYGRIELTQSARQRATASASRLAAP